METSNESTWDGTSRRLPSLAFGKPSGDSNKRARQYDAAKQYFDSFPPGTSTERIFNEIRSVVEEERHPTAHGVDSMDTVMQSAGGQLLRRMIRKERTRDDPSSRREPIQLVARGTSNPRRVLKNKRYRSNVRRRGRRGQGRVRRRSGWEDGGDYMMPSGYRLEQMIYPMELHYDTAATTDGSGVFNPVLSDLVANAPLWSSFATPFELYRVTKFTVRFEPLKQFGGGTAITFAPQIHVIDRDDATALTGYSVGDRYGSAKIAPGNTAWSKTCVSTGINELGFIPCASPAAALWIKVYSSGNTASTTIGRVFITYYILFKGMGIT